MLKHTDAGVAIVMARRWYPAQQARHLGQLVDSWVNARQGVGFVVDYDDHLEMVQHGEVINAHRSMLPQIDDLVSWPNTAASQPQPGTTAKSFERRPITPGRSTAIRHFRTRG